MAKTSFYANGQDLEELGAPNVYATAAAASAVAAAASATSAATSATASAASAATSAASIATVAASAAAAAASETAAELAETNAETAETNAEAALAAALLAQAAAELAEAHAETAETNAETAETNAAASAVTASGHATTASGHATTATTQAGNALTSANNAAASYDSFDDRYLGSKASNPTLDNDGNALLTGALYWNSVSNEMRAYSGSVWATFGGSARAHGQCSLSLVSGSLKLLPKDGDRLLVNGTVCTVPTAGVTLAATGLTAGNDYYIYATASGGVVNALEASTTAHVTSATPGNEGVEIKSGDDNRTLVGFAGVVSGPAFADTATQRLVLSWFNRRPRYLSNFFSTTRTTASTVYIELNSEIRCAWLTWSGESVIFGLAGCAFSSTTSRVDVSVGVDSTSVAEDVFASVFGNNTNAIGLIHTADYSEGRHYSTVLGRVNGGTGSYANVSGSPGDRFTHKVQVQG